MSKDDRQQQTIWDEFEEELRSKLVKVVERRPPDDALEPTHALPAASVFFIGLFSGVISARVACACSMR